MNYRCYCLKKVCDLVRIVEFIVDSYFIFLLGGNYKGKEDWKLWYVEGCDIRNEF